ncbi:CRISPR-associated helicase Cas3' [Streptomyces sp. NBC_01478]|uniref:CRISPR-associated helicase Cas3' n=1 Tax=Streptomyces sp. NBC_01478 TaxID=2903882 RepID=UPI002E36F180|nr:CRISPR-associated helicase Cas3' [Streptomyces sp. NBC_01478]
MGVVEDSRPGGLDLSLWGKYSLLYGLAYSLLFHQLDAAAVMGELWDRYLTPAQRRVICRGLGLEPAQARCEAMFLAGAHDIGKAGRFQMCEPGAWAQVSDELRADAGPWRLIRHERASMHTAVELLADLGYRLGGNTSPAVRAAQILGAHHGRYLQCDLLGAARPERVRLDLGGPLWQDLRRRYLAQVRYLTGAGTPPPRISTEAAVLLTGLIMVADRLVSQPHVWMRRAMAPASCALTHWINTRHPADADAEEGWAAEVVTASGLERITLPEVPFTQAHPHTTGPNRLQASVIAQLEPVVREQGAGILVVTDSTGAGKTITGREAARTFNRHCGTRGMAVLQPTTAIADAAYDDLVAYVAAHRPRRAPVTLVHSHPWTSAAYHDKRLLEAGGQLTLDEYFDASQDGAGRPGQHVTVPDPFLRGWDRALLAQFTVATIDQALMAVLPVRYSALRMLALSGRTVILDEVHVATPYMRRLTARLLHWLAALGTPVVLLSATLAPPVARELVHAYLAGAGLKPGQLDGLDVDVPYPGWLFAAARDGAVTRIDPAQAAAHVTMTRRRLTVQHQPVLAARLGAVERTVADGERLHRIAEESSLVLAHGGCMIVVCATVADAQDTFRHLARMPWPRPRENLVLLHARFPGHQREAITRRVRARLGPAGTRPERLAVVTTSLLDMSLDIDCDLMISDLASLSRLLQRAGRLWRFERLWQEDGTDRRRPGWILERGPRLTVLAPVADGRTHLPHWWGRGEPAFELHAAAHLLAQTPARPLDLPAQLPGLLETASTRIPDTLAALHTAYQADLQRYEHLGQEQAVPPPARTGSLADLYRHPTTAGAAPTREGSRPRRLLACYRQPDGSLHLDPAGTQPLPDSPRLPAPAIRAILERTLDVPEDWLADAPARPPESWRQHALLADLTLLIHDAAVPGPVRFGTHLLHLDAHLGLVHDEARS